MTATKDDGSVELPPRVLIEPSELRLVVRRCPEAKLFEYSMALSRAFDEAEATSVTRASAMLAQLAHETDDFRALEEYASGEAYEGRMVLGNTQQGDGRRFKGRGFIQLTGRANYTSFGAELGVDLVEHPQLAAEPVTAARIAAAYWRRHSLNMFVDGLDFRSVTRAINGAATEEAPSHHARRVLFYHRALEVLGRSARLG